MREVEISVEHCIPMHVNITSSKTTVLSFFYYTYHYVLLEIYQNHKLSANYYRAISNTSVYMIVIFISSV